MDKSPVVVPFFSPYHAPLIQAALDGCDINIRVIADCNEEIIRLGLESVNNDACYSAIVAAGQVRSFLKHFASTEQEGAEAKSCKDTQAKFNVCAPLTCVRCRAGDVPYILDRALHKHLYSTVDIREAIDRLPNYVQRRIAVALIGADVLLQTRLHTGSSVDKKEIEYLERLLYHKETQAIAALAQKDTFDVVSFAHSVYESVSALEQRGNRIPAIGVVGSPSLLFNPSINGSLVQCIEQEGCEAVLPYLAPLFAYALRQYGVGNTLVKAIDELSMQLPRVSTSYPCETLAQLKDRAYGLVPDDIVCGSGFLFAGQVMAYWAWGIRNVLYASVFACMAGHVTGQGVLRSIRAACPSINLASVEYDPGTSVVNQVNRIKLLASVAKKSFKPDLDRPHFETTI